MTQSKPTISPTVGTRTEMMMICVVWTRCTGTELCAGLAVDDAMVEARDDSGYIVWTSNGLTSVGTTGDGGKAAVHPSYPNALSRDEYALSRKTLYFEVTSVVAVILMRPDVALNHPLSGGTENVYGSTKGTDETVCLRQSPVPNDVDVTE